MPSPPLAPPAAASRNPGATVTINTLSLQKSASEPLSDAAVAAALAAASLSSPPSVSTSTTPPRPPPCRSHKLPETVRLNVGGVRVEVSRRALLEREPTSMLASLVRRYHEGGSVGEEVGGEEPEATTWLLGTARDETGALFLDGDGELFKKFILPYLRFGEKSSLPCDGDDRAWLALEADFLQLAGLGALLAAPPPRPWPSSSSLLSSSFPSSPDFGASSLWLPADEARARAAAAGPEGALDEALCERGGRLLDALELVLSLARGWILASAPGGETASRSFGGGRSISASAATTTKPPPIVCRLRGRGITHVARPGCFDAFVEEGVVSCGEPASLSTATSSSSSSTSLAPSISNASALISRLSSTVEREIASAAENATTSPTQQQQQQQQRQISTSSSLASSSSAAAEAPLPPLDPSTSDAAAQHQQRGPRTSYSFSRELEAEFDAPIMIGGGYDRATYCPGAESSAAEEGRGREGSRGGGGSGGGGKATKRLDWEKCSPAEKNMIVYAALSSAPLENPTEALIKESILAIAERPALVRLLLVRRFGFAEGTSVRASLEAKISWRPSRTYCSADVFECVQATCVIDLAMP